MNKNSLLIVLVMFIFVFGLQIAEPAAAAGLKEIDHGSYNFTSCNILTNYKWTTYQKGANYVKMVEYYYFPQYKSKEYCYMYFQKVSATKLKVSEKIVTYYDNTHSTKNMKPFYEHTKLTAVKYYWKEFRPDVAAHP